ncbi:histone-lysine N-methyltransferase SETMAR [Trichonephila clavipes]|uniref:Histone-lysine N-methyltransferase SETMAR n=1 Tax=Trichonephila clavipes TaxID=2585209 RepID=A0A8X6SW37_TRICX|nr:histone-lysine N-methyltransferase SETMAR [Trichonephila clavipes]
MCVSEKSHSETLATSVSDKTLRESEEINHERSSVKCAHDRWAMDAASQYHPTVHGKKGAVQTEHPPFSPHLNLPDFFLFQRLKLDLKGKIFDDISDIQRDLTRLFNSITKEDFLQSFQCPYSRSQCCIVMGGDFFEWQ